ncbi:FecCD family ABC transporter permease [Corynebacterium kroppenstedtii]|uniref:FecCD family ABC transporter permease n=1 Tax=Corynebacterium kroppenstedtii TaxID=161879 RepID=UPI0026EC2009|nr:iron ABC transporter permease [Corynebacterium kroppenstedtii]MDU7286772.1 iron ABC transporter permease [Corynebacterium kroppenstedtii]
MGVAVLIISLIASTTFGSARYDVGQVWSVIRAHFGGTGTPDASLDSVVWDLRAPRGILAAIVGAGLALAGVAIQTLVRNPLADPYLLGISSGASVGATSVITLGWFSSFGLFALTGGALAGAIAATLTVYFVAMGQGGLTPLRLVLSGVAISAAFSAIANFMVFKSPYGQAAQGVMFWMLGSVAGVTWSKLWIPSAIVAVTFVLLMAVSSQLDALSAGPDTAAALGINVAVLRQCLFFLQAILVGALVAVSGGIGFVGLVIPHIARLLVGPRHRRLVPAAMLCGAIFLVWVDVLARVAAIPQEIPLGVVTGIIGAPVFLILMGRSHYRFGGQE